MAALDDLRLSEALLQGLLAHIRRCRREQVARVAKQYPVGYLIGYRALIEASGVTTVAAWMTAPLAEIGAVARRRGWPDLPALVVNQAKGYPGPGYFKQPGAPMPDIIGESDLKAWEAKALACMADWPLPRDVVRWSNNGAGPKSARGGAIRHYAKTHR